MQRQGTVISKNYGDRFRFRIDPAGGGIFRILCTARPSFNGASTNVEQSHLYSSGEVCFFEGKEPRSVEEAERRACEFAEFFSRYRRNGRTEG